MIEKLLAFFNKRVKEPDNWDSIHSYKDMTTLYACKYCYTIVEQRPGYIKELNDHVCHSLHIPMRAYISLEKIIENKKNWEDIKEDCYEEE